MTRITRMETGLVQDTDKAARKKRALSSRQGKPPTGGSAVAPPRTAMVLRGGGDGTDLVVAIPRAKMTDDLAALLFRRGERVV